MAYEVIVKKRFANKVIKVLAYLEKEWSQKVAGEFLLKVDRRFNLLKQQPFVGIPSQKIIGVRGILITRHNKMYYKIEGTKVIILNLYDTRISPRKNPY